MSKQTGGPAFPNKASGCGGSSLDSNGMTLRDYFAAQAISALWSSAEIIDRIANNGENNGLTYGEAISKECYKIADAMIAERNK